jgi:hypothetical protein
MAYEFTMVLNRQITPDEVSLLHEAGCDDAAITTATVGVDSEEVVTQMDFAREAPSLTEAIQSALDAVKSVSELTAITLTVPAQPNAATGSGDVAEQNDMAISADETNAENSDDTVEGNGDPVDGDAVQEGDAVTEESDG